MNKYLLLILLGFGSLGAFAEDICRENVFIVYKYDGGRNTCSDGDRLIVTNPNSQIKGVYANEFTATLIAICSEGTISTINGQITCKLKSRKNFSKIK